jgi:hypothetical protein
MTSLLCIVFKICTKILQISAIIFQHTHCFILNVDTEVAPSFAEMDEAIHCSIQQSFSDLVSVGEERLHLSPVHQLVMNCVWLNLKVRYVFVNFTFNLIHDIVKSSRNLGF